MCSLCAVYVQFVCRSCVVCHATLMYNVDQHDMLGRRICAYHIEIAHDTRCMKRFDWHHAPHAGVPQELRVNFWRDFDVAAGHSEEQSRLGKTGLDQD